MLDEINNTIHVLSKGGIILYPTDTVWGIGCDATNLNAVSRIYKLKKRAANKTMIILVSDTDMLKEYVDDVPEIAWDLINSFEQPTTIIYPKAKNIAKSLVGSDGSVAVRIVMKDKFCKQLVTLYGKPIVSTSANFAGEATPLLFTKISEKLIDAVDYVVDIDHDKVKQLKPSTILKLHSNGEFQIIRK
jgi:L-threonylcarbamoyladenylate synthase